MPRARWLALRKGEIAILHHHDAQATDALPETAIAVGRQLRDLGVEMVGLALRGLAMVSRVRRAAT